MFNLQGSEIIFILLIALVVLGPEKLPGAIRRVTSLYAELRKLSSGFQEEFKSVLDEPLREMKSTADLMKNAADPKRIAEEAEREVELEAAADKKAKQARETTTAMEAAGAAHLAGTADEADGVVEPPAGAFDDPVEPVVVELDDDTDVDADSATEIGDPNDADPGNDVANVAPPVRRLSSFDFPADRPRRESDGEPDAEERSA